jgi:hypothetical protein
VPEGEIVRAAVTEVEIAVAAEDVLVAAVVDAGAAGDPAVAEVVAMAVGAEDDTKPFATDFTDQEPAGRAKSAARFFLE